MSQAKKTSFSWADYVSIASRYQRSINLERDAKLEAGLDGYHLTPLVRSTALRIAEGLQRGSNNRALSLTGPYGSGKSAFALFLSRLLAPLSGQGAKWARKRIQETDRLLDTTLFGSSAQMSRSTGLLPVLATGERARIETILLRALRLALTRCFERPGAKPDVLRRVHEFEAKSSSRQVSAKAVVELFELAAEKVIGSGNGHRGLLIVLDEAGKALEHAAHDPSGDIQVLQELAEAACRSDTRPIVFLVSLHQTFETYAGRLSSTKRNEWSKVQGRFQDIAFQESSDQILDLIGSAVQHSGFPAKIERRAKLATGSVTSSLGGADVEKARLTERLQKTIPLHPATALVLGPLFRSRLAQNERSLFAFLSSSEPFGFREFLEVGVRDGSEPGFYTIDRLYDYVSQVIGMGVHGHHGRCWAQVQETLVRLPQDATELDARVVKSIGLLSAVGDAGTVASEALLRAALGDTPGASPDAISQSLRRLSAKSLIVYRKYRDAFQLWDGSDLNIEALAKTAREQLEIDGRVVERITRLTTPRALVARRHFFETGTLRYLPIKFADESIIGEQPLETGAEADGLVWLLIPSGVDALVHARSKLRDDATWGAAKRARPVLVIVPDDALRLRELALDLAALERVRSQTPELQSDPVARRELAALWTETETLLRREVSLVTSGVSPATLYWRGQAIEIGSARELTRRVSDVCDAVYSKSPHIHNELVNRASLSSAAAAARRNLLQAMVERGREACLGFEGYPPEVSIYRSVLVAHGLHVVGHQEGAFVRPSHARPGGIADAYREILEVLSEREDQQVGLGELYERLRRPPFGVKDGILPILLTSCLLENPRELALYEDARFCPGLTTAVLERMLKTPEKFAVQLARIAGGRAHLLSQLAPEGKGEEQSLLSVVRHLIRSVHDLPDFARHTTLVSPTAQAVRNALLSAREPGPLMFSTLPAACGLDPVLPRPMPKAVAEVLSDRLRAAVNELRGAFADLLNRIEQDLISQLGLSESGARRELAIRSRRLQPVCADVQLRAFLVRSADDSLDRDSWIVSIGTLLIGKPPHAWNDRDVEQMPGSLGEYTRRFKNLEAVSLDQLSREPIAEGISLIRLSVAQAAAVEQEIVVTVRAEDGDLLDSFCERLRAATLSASASLPKDIVLAGLAIVSRQIMSELGGDVRVLDREADA